MLTPCTRQAHIMHTPCTWQVAALRQLFVPDEAQAAVWRLLGAILLLGEVTLGLGLGVYSSSAR